MLRAPGTYRAIERRGQVGDEHLGVDGLQVPGEVPAVEPLSQPAPVCNVTIRLLLTKPRERIKPTSKASKEAAKPPLELGPRALALAQGDGHGWPAQGRCPPAPGRGCFGITGRGFDV